MALIRQEKPVDYEEYRARHEKRARDEQEFWEKRHRNPLLYPSFRYRYPFALGPRWLWLVLPLAAILTALWGRRWLGF